MLQENNLQTEEKSQSVSSPKEEISANSYLEALNEYKQKVQKEYVPRELYEKSEADRKVLMNEAVNGYYNYKSEEETAVEIPSRLECYKLYRKNKFNSDLEYWTNLCNLRDATIAEYGKDPCVTGSYGVTPNGQVIEPYPGEAENIESTFNTIKELIHESNGNPKLFSTYLKNVIK